MKTICELRAVPQEIAPDVWIVDGPEVQMRLAHGVKFPFSTRMTVIRLANGDLFCHSPAEYVSVLAERVEQLGRVAHLVSPNKIHYIFIPAWKRQFPALSWASPGVGERMRKNGIDFTFDRSLEHDAPPWAGEIDQMILEGSSVLREVFFFHRSTRTLILADLVQNHEAKKLPPLKRALARFAGAVHPDGTTPIDLRTSFLGSRKTLQRQLETLRGWQPERIIIAHGHWFDRDGEAELARIFRWVPRMVF